MAKTTTKKTVAPKSKKVATKKTTAKKTAAKKTAATKNGSDGLRKPQVRVLEALAKNKRPLTRAEISEKGNVDRAMLNSYIGAHDEAVRAKNDKVVMPSLLTLKAVRYAAHQDGKTPCYEITATGRKILKSASS